MLNRPTFPFILPFMILALFGGLISYKADAQDSPNSQEPKRIQPKAEAVDRKDESRQDAQTDERTADKKGVLKLGMDLVSLDVMVIDQNNLSVADLKKEDFTIYEDKVKQSVEEVIREEVPLSFGIVIDTSGSMWAKMKTVSDAAISLIRRMHVDDEAFVASFNTNPELAQDFTSDRRELEDSIGELYASGGTSLLDAIIATSDYASEKGHYRRKALVIFSDGMERNSEFTEKEVMEAINENDVQVYLVGFVDEEDEEKGVYGASSLQEAKHLLSLIADDSGGRAFFPKNINEIPAIADQIAKDLRSQYVISYYSSNYNLDGAFRAVKVIANSHGSHKLITRTRRGYYSRNEKGRSHS
ncbi:MAG: VWA domain-containing protein [Chloracidobacterium sp.]|nr:VWA domain-containing protein [Chloracidobacterium sp.]